MQMVHQLSVDVVGAFAGPGRRRPAPRLPFQQPRHAAGGGSDGESYCLNGSAIVAAESAGWLLCLSMQGPAAAAARQQGGEEQQRQKNDEEEEEPPVVWQKQHCGHWCVRACGDQMRASLIELN